MTAISIRIFYFTNLNINLISITEYSMAIDQVKLAIAHDGNTISQTIDNKLSIGSVLTLHFFSVFSITAKTLSIAIPY